MKTAQLIEILQQRDPNEELFILSTDNKNEKLSTFSGVNLYLNRLCLCTEETYLEDLTTNEQINKTNLKKLNII